MDTFEKFIKQGGDLVQIIISHLESDTELQDLLGINYDNGVDYHDIIISKLKKSDAAIQLFNHIEDYYELNTKPIFEFKSYYNQYSSCLSLYVFLVADFYISISVSELMDVEELNVGYSSALPINFCWKCIQDLYERLEIANEVGVDTIKPYYKDMMQGISLYVDWNFNFLEYYGNQFSDLEDRVMEIWNQGR